MRPSPEHRSSSLIPVAGGVAVLSIVSLVVGLSGPTWLVLFGGSLDADFQDLNQFTDVDSTPAVQRAYFSWAAWAITIVIAVALVAATVVPRAVVRRAGAVLALAASGVGIAMAIVSVVELDHEDPGNGFVHHLHRLRVGAYLDAAGLLLAVVAGGLILLHTRRSRRTDDPAG